MDSFAFMSLGGSNTCDLRILNSYNWVMDSIIRIGKELTLYIGWAKHRCCVVGIAVYWDVLLVLGFLCGSGLPSALDS